MTDKRLSSYDRDGLRKQAEKRRADKLDASADLLAACKVAARCVEAMCDRIDEHCADVDCLCTMPGKTAHSQAYRGNELAMLNAAIAKSKAA